MTIKRGDRVRVTIEAEVRYVSDGVIETKYHELERLSDEITSVEKIEPPVVTFKPGQVVRCKVTGEVRAIAIDGWINLTGGRFYRSDCIFTSEYHDLVSLDTLNTEENN